MPSEDVRRLMQPGGAVQNLPSFKGRVKRIATRRRSTQSSAALQVVEN